MPAQTKVIFMKKWMMITMIKSINSKIKCDRAYELRQKEKGIRVRGFRLNDAEWEKVKEFIRKMREENALCNKLYTAQENSSI